MVDENYLEVLRAELAHVYAENLVLKAQLMSSGNDRSIALENVMYFLDSVNPERVERRVLENEDMSIRTGEAFIEVLKEVAHAELGASSLTG